MAEPEDEGVEPLYNVPTHLKAAGSVGFIPDRVFYLLVVDIVLGVLVGGLTYLRLGNFGWVFGFVPFVILLPFHAWWLDPPFEHGLMMVLAYPFRRKSFRPQNISSTRLLGIENGVVYLEYEPEKNKPRECREHWWQVWRPREPEPQEQPHIECRAVLALPTVNTSLMSIAGRKRHRRQFGAFLDGIGQSHQIQIVIRAEPMSPAEAIGRMRLHRNPNARRTADWLSRQTREGKEAVDRRRYLIVPAPNPETLEERVIEIVKHLSQIGLTPDRMTDEMDLKDLIDRWWTWRPHPDRFGAERAEEHSTKIQTDGEWSRVFALGGMPSSIATNWWERLIDGDLPCDVSMTLKQQDLAWAKFRLDVRYNQLHTSSPSPKRQIALDQIRALRLSFEGRNKPWDAQILFVVRGPDERTLDRRSGRLIQQCRDMGAKLNLLRWEQYRGFVAAQALCLNMLPRRNLWLESGTVARTTPFPSSTLQVRGGIPLGMAGNAPVLLTTRAGQRAPHMGWFGSTGAGKGFALRCFLARRHFAERLRVFVYDADESHEYDGRFMDYLGGGRLVVRRLEDLDGFLIDPLYQAFGFCVCDLPEEYRSKAFAKIKNIVQQHQLEFPSPTAFVVDEVTTILEYEDQTGARELGNAAQTWRKTGLELHPVTQRTSDYWGFLIGRKIAGNLPTKWYGAQEETETAEMAHRLGLTPEEKVRLESAGIGQALVITLGRRAWVDFYEQASPEEYAMSHTDPPEQITVSAARAYVA